MSKASCPGQMHPAPVGASHGQRAPSMFFPFLILMKTRHADVPLRPRSRRTRCPEVSFCCQSPALGPVGSALPLRHCFSRGLSLPASPASSPGSGAAAGPADCEVALWSDGSNPASPLFFHSGYSPTASFTLLTPPHSPSGRTDLQHFTVIMSQLNPSPFSSNLVYIFL